MRGTFQRYIKDWRHYSFSDREAIVTARSFRNRVYINETSGVVNVGLILGEGIVFNNTDIFYSEQDSAISIAFEDTDIRAMCLELEVAMKLLDVSCQCDFVLRRLIWSSDGWCIDVRGNSLRSFSYETVRHCSTCGEKLPLIETENISLSRFERISV